MVIATMMLTQWPVLCWVTWMLRHDQVQLNKFRGDPLPLGFSPVPLLAQCLISNEQIYKSYRLYELYQLITYNPSLRIYHKRIHNRWFVSHLIISGTWSMRRTLTFRKRLPPQKEMRDQKKWYHLYLHCGLKVLFYDLTNVGRESTRGGGEAGGMGKPSYCRG